MNGQGLSERRALRIIGMSPSAYRYQPVTDSKRSSPWPNVIDVTAPA